jgi:hypothetical protein
MSQTDYRSKLQILKNGGFCNMRRDHEALLPEQLEELSMWFDECYSAIVDAPLKADIEAGRFDERIDRAIAESQSRKNRTPVVRVRDDAHHGGRFLERLPGITRRHPRARD